jgi:hypothetical protein
MRMVIGAVIELDDDELVDDFIDSNPEFKVTEFPESDAIHSQFPYRNHLSYILAAHKTYSAFGSKLSDELKKDIEGKYIAMVEIYSEKYIDFY